MTTDVTYRPDIDGLRALAVLSVLFYHLGLSVPGGFVGVDIFFVISGYLITTIIYRRLNNGEFSILDFMERRIRRIFPPLLLVIIFTLGAGYFLLLPLDFAALSRSTISQLFLVSNVHFYLTTGGYFGAKGEVMPLLHTWSLSVEEQFYLIMPLALMVLFKWARQYLRVLFVLTLLISFGISAYGSVHHPDASFYLLPTRAWELGLGALIPIMGWSDKSIKRQHAESLVVVGTALMFTAIFFFNHDTTFPGVNALLPCIGAFVFILGNQTRLTLIGKVFSLKLIVGIGLISYSVYLWHWPLTAYANYIFLDTELASVSATIIILSLLLGYLTWKYIEPLFRKKKILKSSGSVFLGWFAGTCVVSATSFFVLTEAGLPERFPTSVVEFSKDSLNKPTSFRLSLEQARSNDFLKLGKDSGSQTPAVFVWGDSHAQSIYPTMNSLALEMNVMGAAAIYPGVLPILDHLPVFTGTLGENALVWNKAVFDYIVKNKVPKVLLVAAWERYLRAVDHPTELADKLLSTINQLQSHGIEVQILSQVPEYEHAIPRWLAYSSLKNSGLNIPGMTSEEYHKGLQFGMFHVLGIQDLLLDPTTVLEDPTTNTLRTFHNQESLYFDNNHLSIKGAQYLVPLFRQFFQS